MEPDPKNCGANALSKETKTALLSVGPITWIRKLILKSPNCWRVFLSLPV